MRDKMPWCAAIVDELRDVFGAAEMNRVIRTGLHVDCEPRLRVHFVEGGHALGKPFNPPAEKVVSPSLVVISEPLALGKRGRK